MILRVFFFSSIPKFVANYIGLLERMQWLEKAFSWHLTRCSWYQTYSCVWSWFMAYGYGDLGIDQLA